MDAKQCFPEVDFSSIKLNVVAMSSLLQTSSEDVYIEENATTQPTQENPNVDAPQLRQRFLYFNLYFSFFFFFFLFFLFGPLFWTTQSNLSTFNSSTVLGRAVKQFLF